MACKLISTRLINGHRTIPFVTMIIPKLTWLFNINQARVKEASNFTKKNGHDKWTQYIHSGHKWASTLARVIMHFKWDGEFYLFSILFSASILVKIKVFCLSKKNTRVFYWTIFNKCPPLYSLRINKKWNNNKRTCIKIDELSEFCVLQ